MIDLSGEEEILKMAEYKVKYYLQEVVYRCAYETFKVGDQAAWDDLRRRVLEADEEALDVDEVSFKAPSDPDEWFELYQKLPHTEYTSKEDDDWYSDRKGTTVHSWSLLNSKNREINSAGGDEE